MGTAGYVPNFTANGTIYPYRVVRMGASAFTALTADSPTQVVLGITDGSTRAFNSTEHATTGGLISLQNGRFVQVTAGGTIAVGDLLKASTDGKVETIGVGDRAFLQACESGTANAIIWAFRVQTWEI